MDFDQQKKKYLKELHSIEKDRSKKGNVDVEILPLLNAINEDNDFYTTSSCAGRIDLFVEPVSGKKHEGEWLFVTHQLAKEEDVVEALKELPEATTWFRMEGAILHVCCRDIQSAERFLHVCKESGWKHSGIIGTKRVIVEATTSERMDVPIGKEGSLFVPETFLLFLVQEANKKIERTREKITRMQEKLYQ